MTSALTLTRAHTEGFELVRRHSERFTIYVGGLGDDELRQPVPGTDWTVGETVAHVHSVYERYTIDRRRAPTPQEVAHHNAEDVARLGVDIDAATVSIHSQLDAMASIIEHVEPDATFPFHGGEMITLAGGWGNLLGELLAHGDDIARATGRPFGIPGDDLEIIWRFAAPVLAGWVRVEAADVVESWELAMPFGPMRLTLDKGEMTMDAEDAPGTADRRIEVADVEALTLTFPYRRRSIDDPALALLASRFYDL